MAKQHGSPRIAWHTGHHLHPMQPNVVEHDSEQLQAQMPQKHRLDYTTQEAVQHRVDQPAAGAWQQPLKQERAESFVRQLTADKSQWAIRPKDPSMLPEMCSAFFDTLEHGHAPSIVGNDRYARKFWEEYCEIMGTTPIRSDVASTMGLDAFGHQREKYLFSNAVIYWMPTIKGRGGRVQGTPESCGKRIDAVNRTLQRLGLPTMPRKLVSIAVKAEMRKYALRHGPEWLQSQRKDPMLYTTVHAMAALCRHL